MSSGRCEDRAMYRLRALALASVLLAACQLNPSVPMPPPGSLTTRPGVWVAYNLGCQRGCEQIHRGDIITAIDGRPVTTGAEVDAADLARGTPVRLSLVSRKQGAIEVTLVATPNAYMRPIERAPPLYTVGTAALDRAPGWARLKAFGQATPAMRLYRLDDPRGYRNGRELYGRHTLIVYWTPDNYRQQNIRRNVILMGEIYAHLQGREAELRAAGVDAIFMMRGRIDPGQRRIVRRGVQLDDYGWAPNLVPIFVDESVPSNGNTVGIQHQAADLRELMFNDGHRGPILLVIDARGIVRWHSRGWHNEDPHASLDAVIDFAVHDLVDSPPGTRTGPARLVEAFAEEPQAPPAAAESEETVSPPPLPPAGSPGGA